MSEEIVVWPFNFPMPVMSRRLQTALEFSMGMTEPEQCSQVDFGFWWALGFARGHDGEWYGLRLLPGVALSECPVLEIRPEGAATATGSLRTFVSFVCCLRWLYWAGNGDWKRERSTWRDLEAEIQTLDQSLGGTGDLSVLRTAIFSDDIRDSRQPRRGSSFHKKYWSWRAEVLRLADSSLPNQRRLAFMIPDQVNPKWPLPEGLEPWEVACAMAGFGNNLGPRHTSNELLFAWQVVRYPAGLDGRSMMMPLFASPDEFMPRHLFMPCESLSDEVDRVPPDWKSDPWWEPTMALAKAGWEQYDGKAHFEAARKLDEAGRPVDALNALISANYWMVRRKPGPRFEVMEYALDLAQRNHWEPLVYNIDIVLHAASQMAGKQGVTRPTAPREPPRVARDGVEGLAGPGQREDVPHDNCEPTSPGS